MASFKFQLLILFTCLKISVSSTPTHLFDRCSNDANFTANSTYAANLKTLLASLSSTNATYDAGFFNSTVGKPPGVVYGLFLCRGDVDTETCKECVTYSVNGPKKHCPAQKRAVVYYDECLIRYTDTPLLSRVEISEPLILVNTMNINPGRLNRFEDVLGPLMNDTLTEAANSPRRFSVKKSDYTVFKKLYILGQCTPDLSRSSCDSCLRGVMARLPTDRVGARILTASCNIRYETYPFFNESFITVTPPPPTLVSPPTTKEKSKKRSTIIIAIVAPITVSLMFFILGYCLIMRTAKKKYIAVPEEQGGDEITSVESLQFSFKTIESSTNKFSDNNKLGKGGFGQVYKGTLPNGQEIAVKRLSRTSGQGEEEFKNEVVLVTKLQHRNLVRLLGFCLEQEENILVYEYVPNKSLDYFLFDTEKRGQLDWSRRYNIIRGVARGILYLHEDSGLRIIHRDLTASNILLDGDMNPKISDFGMARMFGVDKTKDKTCRIIGTCGYLSREYAMHGKSSVKSDVYSFGVLVLEIITGEKNSSFYKTDGPENLLSYAWKLWNGDAALKLLDSTLGESCSVDEVIRCIHISLLCCQEDPAERPNMSTLVLVLNSSTVILPDPQEPKKLFRGRKESDGEFKGQDLVQSTSMSLSEGSITKLYPR